MNVYYFVNRWPRGKDRARSDKIFSIIQSLINLGHNISLFSSDISSPDSSQDLMKLPIEKIFVNPKKIGSCLAAADKKPDLALFNTYQMEQMFSIFMFSKYNKCPRVLEVNQLHGLEMWRKKNYLTLGSPFLHEYGAPSCPTELDTKFSAEELQSIKRSDYYFCGNDYISHYLRSNLKLNNLIIQSLGIPAGDFLTEVIDLEYRQFKHRKHFAFLGNVMREKNVQMIELLIKYLWPYIRKQLKNAELHIYGQGYNKDLQARKKQFEKNGIILKGFLEEIQEIQRYKALLFPIQYTTGTKGSIVESWFQHTPVVTTPIGAEGLFKQTCEPLFSANQKGKIFEGFFKERTLTNEEQLDKKKVENYYKSGKLSEQINNLNFGGLCNSFTYAQFVQNAIKLYTDEKLWNECLRNSRASFLKNHSELQMEVNLSFGLSQVELAVHESRRKKEYSQEWDKYIKSKEGYSKLHEKNK